MFFKEGQEVKKGEELFEIDPRPYQQALDQAQAALQKDIALVSQAEANLARDRAQAANAKQQATRYAGLAAEGVISKDQNDSYQTTSQVQDEAVRADEAAINSAKASVVSDHAAIETAKLNLSYCYIRSPIDGRAGSLLLQAGNLVKANDTTALVNINQLQPVYVTFSAPEQLLPEIRRYDAGHALSVSGTGVADGANRAVRATGQLTFIDNTVDSTTGTIKLKADLSQQRPHSVAGSVHQRRHDAADAESRDRGSVRSDSVGTKGAIRFRRETGPDRGNAPGYRWPDGRQPDRGGERNLAR